MLKSLVLALLIGFIFAADEATKLPQSVQAIVEKAEKDVSKNRQAYDDANKKVFDGVEKTLKVELDRLTKAGKLDEAMAVKKEMERFRSEIVARVDERGQKGGADLLGNEKVSNVDLKVLIVGEWLCPTGIVVIDKKLNAVNNGTKGSVAIDGDKFTVSWENGWKHANMFLGKAKNTFVGTEQSPNGDIKNSNWTYTKR